MLQVVDYSFARPNPADLAAAGYLGAMRYLAPLPNPKVITGDEVASLHANQLAVGLVYEGGASNVFAGAAQGAKDGKTARKQADALGFPMDRPIYFAVDRDAQTFQFDTIDEYGRAFGAETGRPVGVYGQWTVVEAMIDRGVATFAWQTAAWSHSHRSKRACLYQRADAAANPPAGCDVNDVLQDDWGQWPAPTVPSAPQEDDDVTEAMYCKIEGQTQVWVAGRNVLRPWPLNMNDPGAFPHALEQALTGGIRVNDPPASVYRVEQVTIGAETHPVAVIERARASEFGITA